MLTLTFQIQFDSNYHVGAGYAKGFNVDSALLREADGKPVLRGSALIGLLRDSAYRLLRLRPLSRHNPDEILGRIFGTPGQAKRWHVSSAQINDDSPDDSESVQRVRIDPRLRRAEEGKLFSQEEGFAGQRFFFSATCPCQNTAALEIVLDEAALIVAAARNVRQLGRSRRRGLGECTIRLTAMATDVSGSDATLDKKNHALQDWLLERFDRVWMQGFLKNRDISEERIPSDIKTINIPANLPIRLRIIVRLDEPLLIAQRSSAGNQYDTRSFIHGGIVMGAFAAMAAENSDLNNKSNYRDFIEIFLRNGIKFSMLYPGYYQSSSIYPSIPAPLGLVTCSVVPSQNFRDGHGDYPARDLNDCPKCANRMVPVEGFVILRRLLPNKLSTKRTSELHIRINEKTQRSAKGDLYGYSAMSSEQYFVGEITCSNEAIWRRLKEMTGIDEKMPLRCRLGKARSRGYGLVTIWLERCDEQPQTWIQIPLNQRVSNKSQIVSITLLTDTIISNYCSQQVIGFESDWLEPALGLGNVKIRDAYARTRVVDSFNSKLGLPRWRDTALVAGSTAWIDLTALPEDWAERMKKLELDGIGLRCNEGFGQIAFNHPVFGQRQKLTESAIMLESEMRPVSILSPDRFMEEWEDKISELLPQNQISDAPFQAFAQWLHAHSDKSIQELIDHLTLMMDPEKAPFGQPDRALIYAIGEAEYGNRNKKNPFIENGKNDIEQIIKSLEYLKVEDPRYWRSGIERLAEWIAFACRDERKGGIQ